MSGVICSKLIVKIVFLLSLKDGRKHVQRNDRVGFRLNMSIMPAAFKWYKSTVSLISASRPLRKVRQGHERKYSRYNLRLHRTKGKINALNSIVLSVIIRNFKYSGRSKRWSTSSHLFGMRTKSHQIARIPQSMSQVLQLPATNQATNRFRVRQWRWNAAHAYGTFLLPS